MLSVLSGEIFHTNKLMKYWLPFSKWVYGKKPRVILACLKIANGNVERLRNELSNASGYYREIINEAEYPYYSKKYFRMNKLSEDEQNKIIEKDRDQYLKWLSRI